ncbi:aminotransferase class I/II-fold pyridoxal phosphate-dependent enzyme [Salsuginibacillus halophilus]|uniref:aminotransferase class I/II-fold pyridoxal phosphate-dependent enzyme n=1 Tax=Salsuginibacillus halophilus TaxID=517424 RepID=UPI0015E70608|nr:aminotransferase class I/II-fold pyridoxal phosphate-dependent enzyme [Salsuginibacillus halophilus]
MSYKFDSVKYPLWEVLERHRQKSPLSGHVPGHKNGDVFPEAMRSFYEATGPWDVTEISGLDDLHAPEGAIAEAERALSELYGTQASFFVVGGSSAGNCAALYTLFSPGDQVIVQRDCHRSILDALVLSGVEPIFVAPAFEKETGFSLGLLPETLKQAFHEWPGAAGVIITSPSYYGAVADLKRIVATAHGNGKKVIVDEAHGAHLAPLTSFPCSAVEAGADIVVQSAHKTLPALTMGAYVHVMSASVKSETLRESLRLMQSSSPSYLIMASLDGARGYLHEQQMIELTLFKFIKQVRHRLNAIEGTGIIVPKEASYDPLKVVLSPPDQTTGWAFQQALEEQGLYVELSDPQLVLLTLPLKIDKDKADRIISAVTKAVKNTEQSEMDKLIPSAPVFPKMTSLAYTFAQMRQSSIVEVPLSQADEAVAAETIVPYPPGIPVIMQGERCTMEQLKFVRSWKQAGGHLQGGTALDADCILIYREEEKG